MSGECECVGGRVDFDSTLGGERRLHHKVQAGPDRSLSFYLSLSLYLSISTCLYISTYLSPSLPLSPPLSLTDLVSGSVGAVLVLNNGWFDGCEG